jgi:hypothetical protein
MKWIKILYLDEPLIDKLEVWHTRLLIQVKKINLKSNFSFIKLE